MSFTASAPGLLEQLETFAAANLEDRWVAEPFPARLALLLREELQRWIHASYPGSTCNGSALDAGSRRRLELSIHSAPVSHRVEIWGLGPDETPKKPDAHAAHSWVIVAGEPSALERAGVDLSGAGLRRVEHRRTGAFSLSLWMGGAAPDGCSACLEQK